jgi:hypothetical protein
VLLAELNTAPPALAPASPPEPASLPPYAPAVPEPSPVNIGWNSSGYTGEVYAAPAQPDRLAPGQPDRPAPGVAKKTSAGRPVAVAAAAVVVLAAAAVAGWVTHWPAAVFGTAAPRALTWTAAEAPLPADAIPLDHFEGSVSGIACPTAVSCVVDGWYQGNNDDDALVETVSNGRWVAQRPRSPASAADQSSLLYAVACPVPGRCIAGGSFNDTGSGDSVGLIDTLSGGTWMPSGLSLPSGAGRDKNASVDSLACPAVDTCVAVGSNWYINPAATAQESQAMIQTLARAAWAPAEAPLPADAATGDTRYSYLYGVACPAPGSCVAVGSYNDSADGSRALVETLANGTWTPLAAPLPEGAAVPRNTKLSNTKINALNYVACTAPGSCVAVGTYTAKSGTTQALVETLANGTWTPSAAPLPKGAPRQDGAVLWGVACPVPGSCAAVGSYYTDKSDSDSQGLSETLSGGVWIPARAPLPGNAARNGQSATLYTVACATAGSCVAGGNYTDSKKDTVALLETAGLTITVGSSGAPAAAATSAAPTAPSQSATTAPAAVISPGDDTPEDAVDGLLQAELAGNWTQACSYLVPTSQSACNQDASQLPTFTGSAAVVGSVVSGDEALVEVTGSLCANGSCETNSDPQTGMPTSQGTFAQAYDQVSNNSNSTLSPVPCIEENGLWYVNDTP